MFVFIFLSVILCMCYFKLKLLVLWDESNFCVVIRRSFWVCQTIYFTFNEFFDLAERVMMWHNATQSRGGPWTVCTPPLKVRSSIGALVSWRTELWNHYFFVETLQKIYLPLNWISSRKSLPYFFISELTS